MEMPEVQGTAAPHGAPHELAATLPDVVFLGAGAFGVPVLRMLADAGRVALVVSQPDRVAGRGKQLTPTPMTQAKLPPCVCVASSNMPASFAPPTTISLGHFSSARCPRRGASVAASATPATKPSCGAQSGVAAFTSKRLA
jgi:hypothetical protein